MIRNNLEQLVGTNRMIRIGEKNNPGTCFWAVVLEVDETCVRFESYDDTAEQWGETILRLEDIYRIDLWCEEITTALAEKALANDEGNEDDDDADDGSDELVRA